MIRDKDLSRNKMHELARIFFARQGSKNRRIPAVRKVLADAVLRKIDRQDVHFIRRQILSETI